MADHYLPDSTLLIDDGVIREFGPKVAVPEGTEIIDARGLLVGPGLIDIHTHAGGGAFFQDDPVTASRALLEKGVTGVLPALYMNLSLEKYIAALDLIDAARAGGECGNIMGYYMEGPYLNPSYGCERANYPWDGPLKPEQYMPLIDQVGREAKVWCIAPEREGMEQFVQDARANNPGVVFSVAHSEATPQEVEALMPYGLRLATHHTNATGTLNKYPECRGVCVDEAVNYHDDIYAEVICDSHGIHVDPFMLRLIRKIKGDERVILISDTFVADGPVPPGYEGVTDINFDHTGEIAGSKITLDAACRNMIKHTGCSPLDAFRFASMNPARLLNMPERGRIARGTRADLVIADPWMNIEHVILKGELIR